MVNDQRAVPAVREDVPISETLTEYDRGHMQTYLRLLDAVKADAAPDEMCRLILGIDPALDPDRARRTLTNHLRRANWMVEVGYRELASTTSGSPDIGQTSERGQKQ